MAGASRGRTDVQVPKKWKERDLISPERTKVWMEPKTSSKMKTEKRVPVVYYLSKDGHLEHPHFIEVPLSSNDGLHLRDVINRLNTLRGKGMASMYSWSSKRSYKSGFVWHDLSENDFIYPAHGQEYVLKGSEFLQGSMSYRSEETASSSSEKTTPETHKSGESSNNFPVVVQRRNQSWSSIDLHEYKVYKTESTDESAGKAAADAGTQTDEKRRRRRIIREEDEAEKTPPPPPPPPPLPSFNEEQQQEEQDHHQSSTELSREEISPPPSSSSPETLESLIKADGRITSSSGSIIISSSESDIRNQTANNNHPSGRVRASTVLKQLISCGSFTVKEESDGSSISAKDQRLSLIQSHYRDRLPHYQASSSSTSNQKESFMGNPRFASSSSGIVEEKEYFSGSIMRIEEESKEEEEEEFTGLKRSSSYNENR